METAGSGARPALLFVVDTEGDDEWTTCRREPPVENVRAVPRFQALCDRYGIRPTYVITHSIAADDDAVAILRELAEQGRAEVGTHLHPWTTPPWTSPYDDCPTFPSELPDDLLETKLAGLTSYVAERVGRAPTAYRAGRFGFDGRSVVLLEKLGYVVDSSVTPYFSWRSTPGLEGGAGGPDFSHAPLRPYRLDHADPCKSGRSTVVEIPCSIAWSRWLPSAVDGWLRDLDGDGALFRWISRSRVARRSWFYPTLGTARRLASVCDSVMAKGVPVFNMMIHSSELHAGASPFYPTQRSIDRLFDRMDRTFERVFRRYSPEGLTLTEAARRLFPGLHPGPVAAS